MNGRYLRVDLGAQTVSEHELPWPLVERFLAGNGLGTELWLQESRLDVDPLGPENALVIMGGLLCGTPVLTASRASVCAKSPLTHLFSESTVGGHFPTMLKATGYDGLVLVGQAAIPVYLWLDESGASIRPAGDLWGLDTYATAQTLQQRHGNRSQVFGIGPAGENLLPIASIMGGGDKPRAAGRTGLGAVMGSKRVKAVACFGSKHPRVFDLDGLRASTRDGTGSLRQYTKALYDFGTAGGVPGVEFSGDLPIQNWRKGSWKEGAADTCGQKVAEEILVGHYSCTACPIRCGKVVRLRKGPHQGTVAHGAEYETTAGFGAMLLNRDLDLIAAANDLCNRLGLDTISTASIVAFAVEAAEKGLIDRGGQGRDLNWGGGPWVLDLITDIAYRRGLGDLLGLGVREAARRLDAGRGANLAQALRPRAAEFAIHAKGLEIAFHDPRAFTSMAVNYATAVRGGCHLEALTYFVEGGSTLPGLVGFQMEPVPEGQRPFDPHGSGHKGALAAHMQNLMATFNPLGLCKFLMRGRTSVERIAAWTNAVMGWQLTSRDLLQIGERLFNRRRLLNLALGLSRLDDTLPARLLTHDRGEGGAAGSLPDLGRMLSEYYQVRGWTEDGRPTSEKLAELGLGEPGWQA